MRKNYKTNQRIKDKELRVIMGEENLGIISREDALKKAKAAGLDLVLFTENAKPPVAKILDYNKFIYKQNKKASASKAKSKKSGLKELRFGPNIGDGDLKIKSERAKEFILDGDQVKVTIELRGRERAFPELAFEKMEIFYENIKDTVKMSKEPKKEGNRVVAIFTKE